MNIAYFLRAAEEFLGGKPSSSGPSNMKRQHQDFLLLRAGRTELTVPGAVSESDALSFKRKQD